MSLAMADSDIEVRIVSGIIVYPLFEQGTSAGKHIRHSSVKSTKSRGSNLASVERQTIANFI